MVVPFLMFVALHRLVKMRVAVPALVTAAGAVLALLWGPAQAADGLSGTVWRLVQFQDGAGRVLRPDDRSDDTLEFRSDSTVAMHLDCHRGRGTWVSRSALRLDLGPLAFTRAECPRIPVYERVVQVWASVRSYVVRDKHLFLSADGGGTYEFEPENVAAAAAPPAAPPARPAGRPTPASWLDAPTPASWNTPGATIPSAPKLEGTVDPRCRTLARTPESEADRRLAALGWDLIGAYQGGWGVLIIGATAGYDGMCRPRAYQDFVFAGGAFAGTLAPQPMDSRTDGALSRVTLQDSRRLVAEYARYDAKDALCCASRTASVAFELEPNSTLVRPVSVSTSSNRTQ